MPQDKAPKKGPVYFGPLTNENGTRSNYRQSIAKMGKEDTVITNPGLRQTPTTEYFGGLAQDDAKAQADFYKKNPAARKAKIASAATAAKNNEAKNRKNAATNALFHKNVRRGDAAQYMRSLQFDMDDAKAAAEYRAEDKREKSPASIQKGMAASTRKTQAASASAKATAGKAPASPMRKLLKVK